MRRMLILRGIPASGKSTFVSDNNLKNYTLSIDDIRRVYGGYILDETGRYIISHRNEDKVKEAFNSALENRLKNGEFVVINKLNTTRNEINRLKALGKEYRYRMYCLDFNISVEEAIRRDYHRDTAKFVGETTIQRIYNKFQKSENNTLPSGIEQVRMSNWKETIFLSRINLNEYKRIHILGDIHGCYDTLQEYLGGETKEDEAYIFVGDYTDRGRQNAEMLWFILKHIKDKNFFFIEGNHEKWVQIWAKNPNDGQLPGDFLNTTAKQLENSGLDLKEVRQLYRRYLQCAYFEYGDQEWFVSHGGVSNIMPNPVFIPTHQLIHGVGGYPGTLECENSFERMRSEDLYQAHGHRNVARAAIDRGIHSFNLEGRIEFGGSLRALQLKLEPDGTVFITSHEVVNKDPALEEHQFRAVLSAIDAMRLDPTIKEIKTGDISSFNYTKSASAAGDWNARNVHARGLYINTRREEVVARGWDKFFNVGEVPETTFEVLRVNMQFPAYAYEKTDGFLGLISYDKTQEQLFITTKADPNGVKNDLLKKQVYKTIGNENMKRLAKYLKMNNLTLLIECVCPSEDYYVIKYTKDSITALALIRNDLTYEQLSYTELESLADELGIGVKQLKKTLNSFEEFENWAKDTAYGYDASNPIEGYVVEDSRGMMLKVKTAYYYTWKRMGRAVNYILGVDLTDTEVAEGFNETEKRFIQYIQDEVELGHLKTILTNGTDEIETDDEVDLKPLQRNRQKWRERVETWNIIELRDAFERSKRDKARRTKVDESGGGQNKS